MTSANLAEIIAASTGVGAGAAGAGAGEDALSGATFVTHFVDEEVVTDEAGDLAAKEAAAANAARPISAATAAEKREMLTKAKKALGDKKPEGNEFVVADKKGETVALSTATLPPKPVLLLKGNEDCTFDLSNTTSVIKLLINGCKRCKVLLYVIGRGKEGVGGILLLILQKKMRVDRTLGCPTYRQLLQTLIALSSRCVG